MENWSITLIFNERNPFKYDDIIFNSFLNEDDNIRADKPKVVYCNKYNIHVMEIPITTTAKYKEIEDWIIDIITAYGYDFYSIIQTYEIECD